MRRPARQDGEVQTPTPEGAKDLRRKKGNEQKPAVIVGVDGEAKRQREGEERTGARRVSRWTAACQLTMAIPHKPSSNP